MDIDTDKIDAAVLALLHLTLHDGIPGWKVHDWDAMDRLHRKRMIDNPVGRAKSAVLTDEGLTESKRRAGAERLRQRELTLQQARYEEIHARRQYDAIDPDNRLVAGELERRWNDRPAAVARLEEQIRSMQNEQPRALEDEKRALQGASSSSADALGPFSSEHCRQSPTMTESHQIRPLMPHAGAGFAHSSR